MNEDTQPALPTLLFLNASETPSPSRFVAVVQSAGQDQLVVAILSWEAAAATARKHVPRRSYR